MSKYKIHLISGMFVMSLMGQTAEAHLFGNSDFDTGNTLSLNLNGTNLVNANSGWYWGDVAEISNYGTQNYAAAAATDPDVSGVAFDNYFVFNIAGLTHPITSASITLNSYDISAAATFNLFAFTGSISDLLSGANSAATFSQMGTGPVVGSFNYVTSDSNQYETITLNSIFISDINSAISNGQQQFALDGVVATVPEAPTLLLMAGGLMGLGAMRRKQLLS
jgi:hypothetical protein